MNLGSIFAVCLIAVPMAAQPPAGCVGSSRLGLFRVLVQRTEGGLALPVKSVSTIPAGSHLIWEPVRPPSRQGGNGEVTAIVVPDSGGDLEVLAPKDAGGRADWRISSTPAAIALVFGPEGFSEGKIKSLVTRNQSLVEQLADYAEQTSEVESLIQELSNAEQSGSGADAALKGFSARYGVTLPKLDSKAPANQQASLLLNALLPAAGGYDPLSTGSAQVQQSAGLAASVAGLFLGNAVGLAAGGAALLGGIKGAVFPGVEFRSAFAQTRDKDSLVLCAKAQPQKARTRVAYLWAYRAPNFKIPGVSVAHGAYLPAGAVSTVELTAAAGSAVRQLDKAREWRLISVDGGPNALVGVRLSSAPNSIEIDLTHSTVQPGDYRLEASWDWDTLDVSGVLHIQPLGDYSRVQLAPESHDALIEGRGVVAAKLTGADFDFLEKAAVVKAGDRQAKPVETRFALPIGKHAGAQDTATVDIDTAARGAYVLMLTQSDGRAHEVPVTVFPPNPVVTGLPIRVNQGDAEQLFRLRGNGLDRIESVSSPAGEIKGAPSSSGWDGCIRLNPALSVGATVPITLKVKGLENPIAIPGSIKLFGPRPAIISAKKAAPAAAGIEIRPEELPAGSTVGVSLEIRQFHDSSDGAAEARPRIDLGCKSGGLRKPLSLWPDDHGPGAQLTAAAPGILFLSIDPGSIGYPGCLLTAAVEVEPEGRSDAFTLGRVVRVPGLDQFTLTNEQIDSSTYAGILKGRDLDVIEKAGWDAQHGLPVESVPAPVPGDPTLQTVRVALPWPAPAPHAPLYLWLRGDNKGRKTALSD